jgi:hypothetical protein
VKISIIFQLVTVLVAIVLFPVTLHYLNLVLPKHNIAPVENVWKYQQAILIVGGICAAFVAFLRTTQGIQKDKDNQN